jgi:hypothetical protein
MVYETADKRPFLEFIGWAEHSETIFLSAAKRWVS